MLLPCEIPDRSAPSKPGLSMLLPCEIPNLSTPFEPGLFMLLPCEIPNLSTPFEPGLSRLLPSEIPNRSTPTEHADIRTLTALLMRCSYQKKRSCKHPAVIYLLPVTGNTIISHFLSSFFISFLVRPPVPTRCRCRGFLLYLITRNDAHTDPVEILWTRDRSLADTSTLSPFPY
jgi:hypothetical protein